jgi:hypothetical protein
VVAGALFLIVFFSLIATTSGGIGWFEGTRKSYWGAGFGALLAVPIWLFRENFGHGFALPVWLWCSLAIGYVAGWYMGSKKRVKK